MKLLVATHGHCFDGLASAALFTRLVAEVRGETPDVTYRAAAKESNEQVGGRDRSREVGGSRRGRPIFSYTGIEMW
jgi:hypothetical protein